MHVGHPPEAEHTQQQLPAASGQVAPSSLVTFLSWGTATKTITAQ